MPTPEQTLRWGGEGKPFRGFRVSLHNRDPQFAYFGENVEVSDYGVIRWRPGFNAIHASSALNGGTAFQGQVFYKALDGTFSHLTAMVGGAIYTYNATADTWTLRIANATFTANGCTVNTAAANVFLVQFRDWIVVSDGINPPCKFKLDSAGVAASIGVVAGAPVAFGRPTVHFSKLFLIKNTERTAITWSEEADPDTGWEAGGFTNVWTVAQTNENPFVALAATNNGLYFLRERGIGLIRGAVTTTFATDGTRDTISEEIGTISVDGPYVGDDSLWFMDQYGRPSRLRFGGLGIEALWKQMEQFFSDHGDDAQGLNQTNLISSVPTAVFTKVNVELYGRVQILPGRHDVAFCYGSVSGAQDWFVFRGTDNGLKGIWDLNSPSSIAARQLTIAQDNVGAWRLYIGDGLGQGWVWGDPAVDVDDTLTGTAQNIQTQVILAPQPGDGEHEYQFDRMTFIVDTYETDEAGSDTIDVGYVTPRKVNTLTAYTASVSQASAAERSDATILDEHHTVGLHAEGRWIMPVLNATNSGRRYNIKRCIVRAFRLAPYPDQH